jgi:mannose-6-phosphate isomerase-like protein (cupin superfamily)
LPYVSVEEAINAIVVGPDGAEGEPRPEASRAALVASDALRIVRLRLEPGLEPHPPHRHPHADEVFIVQDGQGLFMVGDEPDFLAGPGSLIFVPRGVLHRIQVPGPEPLVWLSIVAPNLDAPDEAVEDAGWPRT